MDPAAEMIDTIKQAQLRILSQVHVKENLLILDCLMYISIGKYTVKGQNDKDPIRPKKSLKNGNTIAINAVITTYAVLHTTLNKFMLYVPHNGTFNACSPVTNWLSDHFSLLQFSTNPNIGWQNTCSRAHRFKVLVLNFNLNN